MLRVVPGGPAFPRRRTAARVTRSRHRKGRGGTSPLAVERGAQWNRAAAAAHARELAARAFEAAADALRAGQERRARAAVERGLRRLMVATDLRS